MDGVAVIVAVGEDEEKNPATVGYTQDYKVKNNYGDEALVVADPSWNTIREGISHANSVAMPFVAVLDKQMTLLYAGDDLDAVEGFVLNAQ